MVAFVFLLSNPLIAQCTDADSDGYYYENGCGTPRDCNDGNSSTYPGASEICNGYDDDCDGILDEGCDAICDNPEKAGLDTRVSYGLDRSEEPSLVWTGSEYGLSWTDLRNEGGFEVYFSRLDSSGNNIGSEVRVTHTGESMDSSIVWTGMEYGIAYADLREPSYRIYFSRLDAQGTKLGTDKRVSDLFSLGGEPSLAWTGHEYGVAWMDQRFASDNLEICFARFDSLGNKIGTWDTRITFAESYSRMPSLVWTGNEYGVAWYDYRGASVEIFFARLNATGTKIGSDIRVTYSSSAGYPSLVWAGDGYGVAWYDSRDGNDEIYFARLDPSGNRIGSDQRVTFDSSSSYYPSLAWTGAEYGVSWMDNRDGGNKIYFTRLDASGNKISPDLRLTGGSPSSYSLSAIPCIPVVWSGNEYGISWDDGRSGDLEIYFTRLRCCDDLDLDGHTEAACSGGDCNDLDDSIYPGAPELCDGKDNSCDGTIDEGFLTPDRTAGLSFEKNKQTMNWDVEALAGRYDVVKGDLMALRSSGGDFTSSLTGCLEDDSPDTQTSEPEEPLPGAGFYYLVRAQRDCKSGTYNTGQPSQAGDRDAEIESSPDKCP